MAADTVTLNNGVRMPLVGYGVYQVDPAECERCVGEALAVGYRSIDTAQAYMNEEGVGRAWKASGLRREDLFLTTKVWISNAGYDRAKASLDRSLAKLQTDYADLVLIHQPFGDYYGTYRALEEAQKEGKVRAIGVSNFYPDRLIDLLRFNEVVPAVNQIETHPYQQQAAAHEIMRKHHVQHESWGPFAEGRQGLFQDPVLTKIGQAHGRSVAQVTLRFLIQRDVVVIPKTAHRARMAENLDVLDFTLSDTEMHAIAQLDRGKSAFFSHQDPAMVEWLADFKLGE